MASTAEHHECGSGRLRVIFRLRVPVTDQDRFLDAYRLIRHQVSQVEGYLGDQLCQSEGDPEDWVITSEWVSAAHFHAWERGADHRRLAAPLVACATARESLRYHVRLTTTPGAEADRQLLEAKS
ncbi:hypothetical protein BBK82_30370 [Lentzea guizhouensis]|uniref:ABM domain-containing protein n=1 Tax=Lentzea guizhouensis TaxID=1586287 RepID=A0A1B2HPR9_9PSEU|nr:antibiotic biosynthesis monooxygenase family protein [Lentzea guizhouensis]ANZ39713.1 hypothetical protein BBK82_30370 [Lentzea guizhouensis]